MKVLRIIADIFLSQIKEINPLNAGVAAMRLMLLHKGAKPAIRIDHKWRHVRVADNEALRNENSIEVVMIKAFALSLLIAIGIGSHANAQTIGYADAIQILARDCGSDIEKYCKSANLANSGITNCLAENRQNLAAQCQTSMVQVRNSIAARMKAQNDIWQICNRDAQRFCPMTQRGRGFVLSCLITAERSVSKSCNQAITNAGWR
ncbi:hypothetical protein L1787_20520 [Acuticoccus sp. M5D2P5]|uniref:hypothetical protein n=1 Tax=Acuticoccus kalidii TaxID=2910977 RepID=UPI001F16A5BF|nr:hypothetical protein [Acuticoccus kalidii]MCF3935784.1 hypothetical protein [Acuticoccus kalidii]